MIRDQLTQAACYYALHPLIERGLRFLREQDLAALPDGRVEIDGNRLYASVSRYETKSGIAGGAWEAHRRYLDIHCLITGVEKIGYAALAALNVTQAYDQDHDGVLLKGRGDFFTLQRGAFAIFFPQDAHMPGRAAGRPLAVRKIVVKALVEAG